MGLLGCSAGLDSKGVAHNEAQGLMFQKDYDPAIEGFTKVIEMDENFSMAYTFRGNSYSALKKWCSN